MSTSADIHDLEAARRAREDRFGAPALPAGGGGNNSDGMEPRVAKLEADVGHLVTDMAGVKADIKDMGKTLGDVRVELAKVSTKVDHLPGKGFIVTVVATSLAILTAVLVFLEKLQHLVATAHP